MLDKQEFPRDKICGDAIGGRALRVLESIDPGLADALKNQSFVQPAEGWKLVAPSGRSVTAHFVRTGLIATRVDFDGFLYHAVSQSPAIALFTGTAIQRVDRSPDGFSLFSKEHHFRARLVIACDGAHSIMVRHCFQRTVDPDFHSGAVRAYFTGVEQTIGSRLLEIHLIKGRLPGYFWIFPLSNGACNVGFGMLSRDISRNKIDLKKSLIDIIQETPTLRDRFRSAVMLDRIRGFGLPLGGKRLPISAANLLCCGDAASLIDPLNGEGIGNAMLSGKKAAEVAIQSFHNQDFSEAFLCRYDQEIYAKLEGELRQKLKLQKLFNRIWLIELLVLMGRLFPGLKRRIRINNLSLIQVRR